MVPAFYLTSIRIFKNSVLREVFRGFTAQYNSLYEKLDKRGRVRFADRFVHPGKEAGNFSVKCVS